MYVSMCIFIFVYIYIHIFCIIALASTFIDFCLARSWLDNRWKPWQESPGCGHQMAWAKKHRKELKLLQEGPIPLRSYWWKKSCRYPAAPVIYEILWNMGIFSISTGDRRISEPSTVWIGIFGFFNDRIGIMVAWGWYNFRQADWVWNSRVPSTKTKESQTWVTHHTLGFRAGIVFLLFCEVSNVDTVGDFFLMFWNFSGTKVFKVTHAIFAEISVSLRCICIVFSKTCKSLMWPDFSGCTIDPKAIDEFPWIIASNQSYLTRFYVFSYQITVIICLEEINQRM